MESRRSSNSSPQPGRRKSSQKSQKSGVGIGFDSRTFKEKSKVRFLSWCKLEITGSEKLEPKHSVYTVSPRECNSARNKLEIHNLLRWRQLGEAICWEFFRNFVVVLLY